MKSFLCFSVICFFVLSVHAQSTDAVSLQWKIAPHDTLIYKVTAQVVDDTVKQVAIKGFPANLQTALDSLRTWDKARQQHSKTAKSASQAASFFGQTGQNPALYCKLTQQNPNIVQVKIYSRKSEQQTAEYLKTWQDALEKAKTLPDTSYYHSLKKTVAKGVGPEANATQGAVYAAGGIASFYLPTGEKNILALFFELPEHAVRLNDSWNLDVHLISDAHSEYDSLFTRNRVTLKALKRQGTDTIAVIAYNVVEFAADEDGITAIIYQAEAEFSISSGRWLKYDGILSMILEGGIFGIFGGTDTTMAFSLKQE